MNTNSNINNVQSAGGNFGDCGSGGNVVVMWWG